MNHKQLEQALEQVHATLDDALISDVELLYDASHHIVESGGKLVRPRLTMLSYLACGGEQLSDVAPLAAAIELVHTATLVHDDINDHSAMRRGRATINSIWGRTFALLTGDYLFTKVYAIMAPYGPVFNTIMSDACVKLVEGETLQALAAKTGEMDRETYKKIISRKTASLFEAGAHMGARQAGASDEIAAAMASFGFNLGLTFQIVDDILDLVGDPETLGKPVGLDTAQQRGVFAVTNGNGHHNGDVAVAEMDPITRMMADLRSSGAVEIARAQAREMARRARAALAPVPPSPARDELAALVNMVLDRDS